MIALLDLWLVSLVLSAIAIVIMLGLIVARWVHGRTVAHRNSERSRLVPLLLGTEPLSSEVVKEGRAGAILTDLSLELIELVRGEERERLVDRATQLGVPEVLGQRLVRGTTASRIAAAEALVHFHDDNSVQSLRAALDDRSPDVRLASAFALASLDAAPARLIIDKLGLGVRENSMLGLGLFKQLARTRPDEIRELIAAPVPPQIKAAAIEAISSTGDYSLVPVLAQLALAADPDAPELPGYLRALGRFAHPAGAEAIRRGLSSPTWFVRSAAAEAAGRVHLMEAAMDLTKLLSDDAWWVRFRAGEALASLGKPGVGLLHEVARYGSEQAKRTAALTLQERGL